MSETVVLNNVQNQNSFLRPGESLTLEFSPVAGEAVAMANRTPPPVDNVFLVVNPDPFEGHVAADTVLGDVGPVGLPPTVNLGGIRIEVFPPQSSTAAHTLETEDFVTSSDPNLNEQPKNRLHFDVPKSLAGRGWRCRFTNISQEDSQCRAQIQYPDEKVTLSETRISRRLLNRTFRQLFIALGLQVYANSRFGLVAVNDEIAHLTDGALSRVEFKIPQPPFTEIRVRMDRLSVTADREPQRGLPKVVFEAGFDLDVDLGKLEIFDVDVGSLMSLRRLDITLSFTLRTSPRSQVPNVIVPDVRGNVILPDLSVDVQIQGDQVSVPLPVSVNQFCDIDFSITDSFDLTQLEKLIECLLTELIWSDVAVRAAASRHLTEGIMGLAERGRVFWGITADDDAYIVQHFRKPSPLQDLKEPLHNGGNQVFDGGAAFGANVDTDTGSGSGVILGSSPGGGIGSIAGSGTVGAGSSPGAVSPASPAAPSGTLFPRVTTRLGGNTDPTLANLDKIDHIVVLMMENRSFDHMLGYLTVRGGRNDIDGLSGTESNRNPITGNRVTVQPLRNTLFRFSPHHEHAHVLAQIADGTMEGFLPDFMARFIDIDPRFGMGFYTEENLPVYDFLAQNFVVCDRWFCAHPGPTMPNRFSTLMGSIPELDNLSPDDPRVGYLRQTNIFDFLTANRISWAFYEQDIAFLRMFDRYRLDDQNILPFSRNDDVHNEYSDDEVFFTRLANGNLPAVTFIDPNYVDVPPNSTANDDHPPADVANGQALIRQIYNALVRSPQWEKTLFVITYDEHGGFYDHVPPPGTKRSPEGENIFPKLHPDGPEFLGVRVPAFVISPWVDAVGNSTLFDHTSIIKTIMARFGRRAQDTVATDETFVADFGDRVRQANHLGSLLTRDTPRLQVPTIDSIAFPEATFFRQAVTESAAADFHDVMARFALPKGSA
ncbi:MAG: hypothetical protein D6791_17685 [Chloroflexi bacterium]|nr:MAG: hypothetical protein D6791_17685 [Chloroflexota bacterium]